MRTLIHVNQHIIKANRDAVPENRQPPLTVKTYKDNRKADTADIIVNGQVVASVVYRPDNPLACGARVWIETPHEVRTN